MVTRIFSVNGDYLPDTCRFPDCPRTPAAIFTLAPRVVNSGTMIFSVPVPPLITHECAGYGSTVVGSCAGCGRQSFSRTSMPGLAAACGEHTLIQVSVPIGRFHMSGLRR